MQDAAAIERATKIKVISTPEVKPPAAVKPPVWTAPELKLNRAAPDGEVAASAATAEALARYRAAHSRGGTFDKDAKAKRK